MWSRKVNAVKRNNPGADKPKRRHSSRTGGRGAAGAIVLPGDLVLRHSTVIERVLEEALDILDLRVVQIHVRETPAR
jgi:hypothetical protein